MATHQFTILLEGRHDLESLAESVYEVCDDCLVSSCRDVATIDFMREDDSFENAMVAALCTLFKLGLRVSRVQPDDLVTEAEIAARIDQSRQSVHLYVTGSRGPGAFPLPAAKAKGSSPLWHWHEVLHWLVENSIWSSQEELDKAEPIAIANAALELLRHKQRADAILETLRKAA